MVHSHICCYPPFSQPLARPEAWACARMLVPCATTAVDNYMSYEIELWATTFSMRCGSWCIIKAYHWTLGLHLRGFKALWSRINTAFSEAYILASTKFMKEYLVLDRSFEGRRVSNLSFLWWSVLALIQCGWHGRVWSCHLDTGLTLVLHFRPRSNPLGDGLTLV